MGKRTGKPRGRPSKSDGVLILSVRNRPEGESVETFCGKNYARLGGDPEKMGNDLIKRYYRIVSEYPPDHVFEIPPSRPTPWGAVKGALCSALLLCSRESQNLQKKRPDAHFLVVARRCLVDTLHA
jgi:hypothetical protein